MFSGGKATATTEQLAAIARFYRIDRFLSGEVIALWANVAEKSSPSAMGSFHAKF